ncbi:hypothetical protein P4544_16090 [Halomonas sp. LY9]
MWLKCVAASEAVMVTLSSRRWRPNGGEQDDGSALWRGGAPSLRLTESARWVSDGFGHPAVFWMQV